MASKIKEIIYKDGSLYKFKNRRVFVTQNKETDDFSMFFKVLTDDLSPRALHKVIGDKIVITRVRLSDEAAISLYKGLLHELSKKNLI